MARVHNFIISVKKAESEIWNRRGIEENPLPMSQGRRKGNKQRCASKLEYPCDASQKPAAADHEGGGNVSAKKQGEDHPTSKAMRLKINRIRKEDCQSEKAADERMQVRTFLNNLSWKRTEDEEEGGITWVELYILFRLHGWNDDSEGENFLTERGKLKSMLKSFKQQVRWLAVHAVAVDQEWTLQTSKTRANRLRPLGVTNKHACIKGIPVLSDEQAKMIAKCILVLKNHLKTKKQKEFWENGEL